MPFLEVKKISQSFGKKQILKEVSFSADLGEVVALLGPNGAGKTTLLKSVIGLLSLFKYNADKKLDSVFLNGKFINNWPISRRVENGLVYLPQNTSLFENLTVLENLKLIYEYHPYWQETRVVKKEKERKLNLISNRKLFEEEMYRWLSKANLIHAISLQCLQLSGGQKRKLEVVRSLLMHPEVIMFDEPFAGVDPKSIYELKSIFVELTKNKIAVVISDHNVDQLLSIANMIYVIIDGKVIVEGGIKDVMSNPYTQEMYFGRQFYMEMSEKFLE